jgi:hypothetical protein
MKGLPLRTNKGQSISAAVVVAEHMRLHSQSAITAQMGYFSPTGDWD